MTFSVVLVAGGVNTLGRFVERGLAGRRAERAGCSSSRGVLLYSPLLRRLSVLKKLRGFRVEYSS